MTIENVEIFEFGPNQNDEKSGDFDGKIITRNPYTLGSLT